MSRKCHATSRKCHDKSRKCRDRSQGHDHSASFSTVSRHADYQMGASLCTQSTLDGVLLVKHQPPGGETDVNSDALHLRPSKQNCQRLRTMTFATRSSLCPQTLVACQSGATRNLACDDSVSPKFSHRLTQSLRRKGLSCLFRDLP